MLRTGLNHKLFQGSKHNVRRSLATCPTRDMITVLLLLLYASALDTRQYWFNIHNDPRDLPQPVSTFHVQQRNGSVSYACSAPKTFKSESTQALPLHSSNECVYAYELNGGYWSFALCPGDKVIQYHEAVPPDKRNQAHKADDPLTIFVLGRFSDASVSQVTFSNQARSVTPFVGTAREDSSPWQHKKVLSQLVGNGTLCDLTLKPRSVEVVYVCDNVAMRDSILSVEEVSTCHYRLRFHSAGLCALPEYRSEVATVECAQTSQPSVGPSRFPVKPHNRLRVADHRLVLLGRGFYIGQRFEASLFDSRRVIFYNGPEMPREQTSYWFAQAFGQALEAYGLKWSDSFVVWHELYDASGSLFAISRLECDGSESRTLSAQLLDPETLLDEAGDEPIGWPTEPSQNAPVAMWNIQGYASQK